MSSERLVCGGHQTTSWFAICRRYCCSVANCLWRDMTSQGTALSIQMIAFGLSIRGHGVQHSNHAYAVYSPW
eukprot:2564266-Amphidinium_carterae.3